MPVPTDRQIGKRGSPMRLAATNPKAKRWAVIIGISKYLDPNIRPLRFAAADAQALYDLLSEEAYGKLEPSRTKLLLDQQATFLNVRRALRSFLKQPALDDWVMIYLACHGAYDSNDRTKRVFLLNHDTDAQDIAATATPLDDLTDAIENTLQAEHVTLLVDACYSNAFANKRSGEASFVHDEFLKRAGRARPGVAIMTAAQRNQEAYEGREWDGHGVFTHYLLEGLRGAAPASGPEGDTILLNDLFKYVRVNVFNATEKKQEPELRAKGASRTHVMGYVGLAIAQANYDRGKCLMALGKRLNDRALLGAAERAFDVTLNRSSATSELWARAQVGRFCVRVAVSATPEQFRTAVTELDERCRKIQAVMDDPQTLLHLGVALPRQRSDNTNDSLAERTGAFMRAADALSKFAEFDLNNPARIWAAGQTEWLRSWSTDYSHWLKSKSYALLIHQNRASKERRHQVLDLESALQKVGVLGENILKLSPQKWSRTTGSVGAQWLTRLTKDDFVFVHISADQFLGVDKLLADVIDALRQVPVARIWIAVDGVVAQSVINAADESGQYSLLSYNINPDNPITSTGNGVLTELLTRGLIASYTQAEIQGSELARPILRTLGIQGLSPVYVKAGDEIETRPLFVPAKFEKVERFPESYYRFSHSTMKFEKVDRIPESYDRFSKVAIGRPLQGITLEQIEEHVAFLDKHARTYGDGYHALGICYLGLGKETEAIVAFQRALDGELTARREVLAELAILLSQANRFSDAMTIRAELGAEFLALDVKNHEAMSKMRKHIYAETLSPLCDTLRNDLVRRGRSNDSFPEGWLTLGIALSGFDNLAEAEKIINGTIKQLTDAKIAEEQRRKGTPIEQCLQQAYYHRGRVLLELKDFLAAAGQLSIAYRMEPNDENAFKMYADALAQLLDGPELERALTQKIQTDDTFLVKLREIMRQVEVAE